MPNQPPPTRPATSWLSLRALAQSLAPRRVDSRRPDIKRPRPGRLVLAAALASLASFGGAALWHSAHAEPRSPHLMPVISSGTAGFKKTPTGELVHWDGGDVTVYIDDSVAELGAGAHDAIERGFGTWLASAEHLPALRFDTTHGAKPSLEADGKSTVMVAEIPFEGHRRDLAITVGFVDPTGKLLEADIVLNARYKWAVLDAKTGQGKHVEDSEHKDDSGLSCTGSHADTSCGGRYDVQDIATHEIGHFFGLGEDNDDPTATMFKCSSTCEIHKRDLETDDDAAIGVLYAKPAADAAPAGAVSCDASSHAQSSSGVAWLLACLAVAAGAAWRRRYSVQSMSLGPIVR